MAEAPKAVDDQTQLFSDLSKQWASVRDLVESFANTYFLKQPPKPTTAPELLQAGFDFSTRLALLWLDGVSVAVRESGRMTESAMKAARQEPTATDQPGGET
jgi:hypothetical protein